MKSMIDLVLDEGVACCLSDEDIRKAVNASVKLGSEMAEASLCIRFSSNEEVQKLNAQWRNKDKVTDVLSFPMQETGGLDEHESLGDIILAVPFVKEEAQRLQLSENNHTNHLIVHATLHLLGYDHMDDDDAMKMQELENNVMNELGLHTPYPELAKAVNL